MAREPRKKRSWKDFSIFHAIGIMLLALVVSIAMVVFDKVTPFGIIGLCILGLVGGYFTKRQLIQERMSRWFVFLANVVFNILAVCLIWFVLIVTNDYF